MSLQQYKQLNPAAFQPDYPQIPQSFEPANEDKLRLLQLYDTVFLVDDSTSMIQIDGQKSRWTTAVTWLAVLAEIAARYDRDGIDVFFLNSPMFGKNIKSRQEVINLFSRVEPNGSTPTGTKLKNILQGYFKQFRSGFFRRAVSVKPLNLIVITDGAPFPENEDPTHVIWWCMKTLDSLKIPKNFRQVGIMFAQVGSDLGATQHLNRLDNMAKDRDIVDMFKSNMSHVHQWTAHDWNYKVVKLLLGAIDKNTDAMQSRPAPPAQPLPMTFWPQQQQQQQQQQYPVASGSNAPYPGSGYGYGGKQTTPQGSPPAYSSNYWGRKS